MNCVPAWVACSQRVITLAEFSQVLESDLFWSYYWRGMGAFRLPPWPFLRGYDPPEYPQVPSQYLCARALDQRYYGPSTAVRRVTGCHFWSGSEGGIETDRYYQSSYYFLQMGKLADTTVSARVCHLEILQSYSPRCSPKSPTSLAIPTWSLPLNT